MRKTRFRVCYIIASVLLMWMILGGCKNDTKPLKKDDKITDTVLDEQDDSSNNNQNDENSNGQEEAGNDANIPVAEPVEYAMHTGSVEVKEDLIYNDDFEGDSTLFTGRGAAKVEIVSSKAQAASNSLYVSGRTALWNGATVDLSEELMAGEKYVING